jgi:hypothetical protein
MGTIAERNPDGTDLLIEVASRSDEYRFGQPLRCTPIQMPINAALVVRARIDEVVGEAGNRRKFVTSLWVKVCVTAAAVDGAMTDADVGQIARTVVADRNVAGAVDHPVVDAIVPANDGLRIQIADTRSGLADATLPHDGERSGGEGQCAVERRVVGSHNGQGTQGQLAAEHRCGEGIARNDKADIDSGVYIDIEIDVDRWVEPPNGNFA